MNLNSFDLDWRSLLIKRYKNYGLDEKSLAVILCLSETLKEGSCLISAEELEWMMTLSKTEIDATLASLIEKHFIVFENSEKKTVTSLRPLFDKLLNDTKKDIIIEAQDLKKSEARVKGESIYGYFETLLGRPLTANEFDRICGWYQEGATTGMIKEAVERVKSKSKRISINAVDKVVLALEKSDDINREGFSSRSDEWREGTAKTIDYIKHKWLPDEK